MTTLGSKYKTCLIVMDTLGLAEHLKFLFDILRTDSFHERFKVIKTEYFRHTGQADAQHEFFMAEDSAAAPPPNFTEGERSNTYTLIAKKTVKIRTLSGIICKIGLQVNNDSLEKYVLNFALNSLSPPGICQF